MMRLQTEEKIYLVALALWLGVMVWAVWHHKVHNHLHANPVIILTIPPTPRDMAFSTNDDDLWSTPGAVAASAHGQPGDEQ